MPLTAPPAAPTAPPATPQRGGTGFSSAMNAFLVWMASFRTWLATYTGWAATHVTELQALQVDVQVKSDAAAAGAATANFKGSWAALAGALNIPASVNHSGKTWMLLNNLANVATSQPGVSADWRDVTVYNRGVDGQAVATSVTLTAQSVGAHAIAANTWGDRVTLPDATTMPNKGTGVFSFMNTGSVNLAVFNSPGNLLGFVPPQAGVDVDLADKSTAAGAWNISGLQPLGVDVNQVVATSSAIGTVNKIIAVTLDATRELVLVAGTTSMHAVVYNNSTGVFGSALLVRTANVQPVRAVLQAADKVLVVSVDAGGTAGQAVILSISASTITIPVAATAFALAVASSPANDTSASDIEAVGASYLVAFGLSTPKTVLYAMTVAGNTVTVGAAVDLDTGASVVNDKLALVATSGTVLMTIHLNATTLVVKTWTITGSAIAAGNASNISASTPTGFLVRALASGRWAVVYDDTTPALKGTTVSIAGTVITIGAAVTLVSGATPNAAAFVAVAVASQVLVACHTSGNAVYFNVLTDNAGTPVAGTSVNRTGVSVQLFGYTATEAWVDCGSAYGVVAFGLSGNNPVINTNWVYVSTGEMFFPAAVNSPGQQKNVLHKFGLMGSKLGTVVPTAARATHAVFGGRVPQLVPAPLVNASASAIARPSLDRAWLFPAAGMFGNNVHLQRLRIAA